MKATKMEYYDSHAQVKALIESGIKTKQAEAIVKTLQLTRSTDIANLSTRDQVNSIEKRMDGFDKRMDNLDKRMDNLDKRMDGFERRMDNFDKRMDGFDKKLEQFSTKDQLNLVEGKLTSKIDKLASDVVIKMLFWVLPMFVAIMLAIFLR